MEERKWDKSNNAGQEATGEKRGTGLHQASGGDSPVSAHGLLSDLEILDVDASLLPGIGEEDEDMAGRDPGTDLLQGSSDAGADRKSVQRRKKRSRKKRRPTWLLLLGCIFLVMGAALLFRELIDRTGGGWREDDVTYGTRDYSIYEDERDDFKVAIDGSRIPGHGNGQQYIAIHFLGVVGENHTLEENGVGTHFYIYYDGTIYQAADLDAVTWQVGTSGYYEQIHPRAGNSNTIGIELCVHCDGDPSDDRNGQWYFTEETQRAAVKLVRCLMREMDIPADHILRHGDIVNKWCPAPYLENNRYNGSWTWDEFLQAVADLPEEEVPEYPVVKKP